MKQKLRTAELEKRFKNIRYAQKQELVKRDELPLTKELHVVYVMTHVGVCGGSKVIFEHANLLTESGIKVTIISHFSKPTWFPIKSNYIKVPFGIDLAHGIPACDVIVATYYDHIHACVDMGIAPVVYFEQGDNHLSDSNLFISDYKQFIKTSFEIVPHIITVSARTATQIRTMFNREAIVFNNAIDKKVFSIDGERYQHPKPYLLMMGNAFVETKRIADCIEAYHRVKNSGHDIDLIWVSPSHPGEKWSHQVDELLVSPPQEVIASLYRGALAYVSASTLESFSLPCLEAMACGCPVVSAENEGVLGYAVHRENALLAPPEHPEILSALLMECLNHPELRKHLAEQGIITAEKYTWDSVISHLCDFYYDVSTYCVTPRNSLNDFEIFITSDHFQNQNEYIKWLRILQWTSADFIFLPTVTSVDKWFTNGHWSIAARRKIQLRGEQLKIFTIVSEFTISNNTETNAKKELEAGNYDAALELFLFLANHETNAMQKLSYYRWIAVVFVAKEDFQSALSVLEQMLNVCTDYSDIYYLFLFILKQQNIPLSSLLDFPALIDVYSDAVVYPDFIFEIENITSSLLSETNS